METHAEYRISGSTYAYRPTNTPHQLVASDRPSTVTSWLISDDGATSSVRASRMTTGSGTATSAIAGSGGACSAPGICGCDGGGGCERQSPTDTSPNAACR